MQVTELQVQRSLEALTTPGSPVEPGDTPVPQGASPAAVTDTGASPAPAITDADADVAPEQPADELPAGLVERLMGSSAVRPERLAEARQRLETGEQPTAEDVAQRLVGRLVCDRLR